MPWTYSNVELFQKIIKLNEACENSILQFPKEDLYQTMHYILEKKSNLRVSSEIKFLMTMTKGFNFMKSIILQQGGQTAAQEICRKFSLKSARQGEYIFKQYDPQKQFIMILSGCAEMQMKQSEQKQVCIQEEQRKPKNYFESGSIFESILNKNEYEQVEYYRHSMLCKIDCVYLVLAKEHLLKIIIDFQSRLKLFDELSQMNLFNGWNKVQVKMMLDHFSEKQFNINNIVYKEGEESRYIYLVKQGEFVLQKTIDNDDEGDDQISQVEAEKEEIQSMINHIQKQHKKLYLFKRQDSQFSAIETHLKNINTQETQIERNFDDLIRKKKLKKKDMKRIKIISEGETFGGEELLSQLLKPEFKRQSQSLPQKRQLTAICLSVQGTLFAISIKDILNKLANNEELLPMFLFSLKQMNQSSHNQVNLIKKQQKLVAKEISIAKNQQFCNDEDRKVKGKQEEDQNILRNYELNEVKIDSGVSQMQKQNEQKQLEQKQVQLPNAPQQRKILQVSPFKSKKRGQSMQINYVMQYINQKQITQGQKKSKNIFQHKQKQKSATQIILQSYLNSVSNEPKTLKTNIDTHHKFQSISNWSYKFSSEKLINDDNQTNPRYQIYSKNINETHNNNNLSSNNQTFNVNQAIKNNSISHLMMDVNQSNKSINQSKNVNWFVMDSQTKRNINSSSSNGNNAQITNNSDNVGYTKETITESSIVKQRSNAYKESIISLDNLDSTTSLMQFQLKDDKKTTTTILSKEDTHIRDSGKNQLIGASHISLNSLSSQILRFQISNYKKKRNQIKYKFEQNFISSNKAVTNVSSPIQDQNLNKSQEKMLMINQLKTFFLSNTHSLNKNSPTSKSNQINIQTTAHDNHSSLNSAECPQSLSKKEVKQTIAQTPSGQLNSNRSEIFQENKGNENEQIVQEVREKVPLRFQSMIKFQNYEQSPKNNTHEQINQIKSDTQLQNTYIVSLPKEQNSVANNRLQKTTNSFQNHRKLTQASLQKTSFLPLKYYAQQLNKRKKNKQDLLHKRIVSHSNEQTFVQPKQFCLKSDQQRFSFQSETLISQQQKQQENNIQFHFCQK